MVKLYKLIGDFNIAEVRESFMRQFTNPEINLTVDMQESNDETTALMKSVPVRLVRSEIMSPKSGGVVEKRSGISNIVRYYKFG